ncbi:hypothetical protein Y032_0138g2075 [Ancylostoma ceylanicum]|uniref:Uncharacterized protein n=1 Tax=Ancylostoma ceylanicum TaxID=53326 RepID=A0A016T4V6_9BILA|nr:hypothetical protein Y032_0138g2075 [Ancylostoma ceylanicum]
MSQCLSARSADVDTFDRMDRGGRAGGEVAQMKSRQWTEITNGLVTDCPGGGGEEEKNRTALTEVGERVQFHAERQRIGPVHLGEAVHLNERRSVALFFWEEIRLQMGLAPRTRLITLPAGFWTSKAIEAEKSG